MKVGGRVTKLDRRALLPDAVVTVELRDVSRADVPATTLGSDVVELRGRQLPIEFELDYDHGDIDERATCVVFAKIEERGRLRYITDTSHRVITGGAPTEDVEILVVPVG